MVGEVIPEVQDRGQLRAKIFSSRNRKRAKLQVFGQEVEMVQPSVKEFMDLGSSDAKELIADLLIRHCVVPGTNDPVFESGDKEAILNWPVGEWLTQVNKTYASLTDLNIEEHEKNLGKMALNKPST